MLRLRVLGPLDLRGAGGRPIDEVLRQPKRLAFLTFLAISPRPFQRRDSLLALFWPELDAERGRAALRRTLYWLRSALGADVIQSRGDELGISTEHFWCDAAEFSQWIAQNEWVRALELYLGDLLEGVHIEGLPGLERALDVERTRLRMAATEASRALTDRALREARWTDAARGATRTLSIDRYDESALRTLMESLSRAGDRAGALRAYDTHARDLKEELGIRPSRETRELHERIRTGSGEWRPARAAESTPVPASVPLAACAVAIFPFTVHGAAEYGYLADGLPDLLAASLDGAGPLRIIELGLLARALRERGISGAPSVEQGADIVAKLGANAFVVGSIVEAAGQLKATCALHNGARVVARVEATGKAEGELFQMVDRLARDLLTERDAGAAGRSTRLAAKTTTSVAALKAYLQGESEFRASRFLSAIDWFRRATEIDARFALAHHRLATAASAAGMETIALSAVREASALRDRLPDGDRALLDAQRAWIDGDAESAEGAARIAVETHPDDAEAWFLLGEIQFHEGPMRGKTCGEAREAMRRALDLDPAHGGALLHLARIAALEGRPSEVKALTTTLRTLGPSGDRSVAALVLGAFAGGDAGERTRAISALGHARSGIVAPAFTDVALFARDLDAADALASFFTSAERSSDVRAVGHLARAHLELARGRVRGALAQLREAEPFAPAWVREVRATFALTLRLPTEVAAPGIALEELESWDAAAEPPSRGALLWVHDAIHVPARHWLCGHLAVRVGDIARAGQHAAALEGLDADGQFPGVAMPYAAGVRAAIAHSRGEMEDAMRLLDGARPRVPSHLALLSPLLSATPERLIRATILRALGRHKEAISWFGAIVERSVFDLIHLGSSHIVRSEILRELDEREAALAHDEALLRMWGDCDEELRPLVDAAAARLRRGGRAITA